MSSLNPDVYGPYALQKQLALGGQGNVWLASGPTGEVILKIARVDSHKEAIAREVRAHAAIGTHPKIARLLDKAADGTWIAVERVFGLQMDKWAVNAEMKEFLTAATQLAEAIAAVHEKGVIHGDVKPANVLIDVDANAMLLDFGCATIGDDAPQGFRGTPGYAAPEVLRGQKATVATDSYGLGGTLYAALAGRPPFIAPDPAALAYLPQVSLPEPVSSFRTRMPSALANLIMALLARDPARRPTIAKAIETLQTAADSPPAQSVIGMRQERDALRRAAVGAADSECRVIVVYGPAGCGRRTLISEAAECARREGMPILALEPKDLLAAMKKSRKPSVVALRTSQQGAAEVAKSLVDASVPGLILLHSDRPIPALGAKATHLTPPPLSRDDADLLIKSIEGEYASLEPVERWWRESFGHPLSIIGRWRGERTSRATQENDLPQPSRKVLLAVRKTGEVTLPDLSRQLGAGEHEVLDFCEVLLAQGMVEPSQNGAAIRLTARGRPVTDEDT
jgi:predicted Ser/Thr protein kinase